VIALGDENGKTKERFKLLEKHNEITGKKKTAEAVFKKSLY